MTPGWADLPFGTLLRQPDQRSCGAASLVVARMATDAGYAALVDDPSGEAFTDEVLAMHRRVTGPVDVAGRLQPPWPRALGTPPWAVARQLSTPPGSRYAARWARTGRARAFDRLAAAVATGRPAPFYVGSRNLPRHVVLALGSDHTGVLQVYDPARGALREVSRDTFAGARLGVAGWDVPWFTVTPS